ncbi:PNPOx family protein [Actinomadura harenae]|uniref:Nitroreductase family deazaflavin-dependent oxidoreductase n=1 Tax=Actinomadura harenae TaxID=2483351 RepID=A0A3M2M1Z0_9ACTN|nr:nitroreductase family deazaflavin-dependent oxidoreductase [Actinomadura harenae]RMI43641.1 nitroreductase family deazaflavin-dependent oxidoreductase [Actinomadura harenae]
MEQQTDPRAAAAQAIRDLRAAPVPPYEEGKPAGRVVAVPGRRSGEPRPFGINVTMLDGRLYLCSAIRGRDWVRNLDAAGACSVERDAPDGTDARYTATLVEGLEAARVLAAYLPQTGYADPELPFALDATVEEIVPHTASTTVFRLDPVPA